MKRKVHGFNTGFVRPAQHPNARILIVDDGWISRSIIACALQEKGYETMEADSGEEALRHLTSARPDFAVVDINMPGMSGFELARAPAGAR